jgi:hypothetical protein
MNQSAITLTTSALRIAIMWRQHILRVLIRTGIAADGTTGMTDVAEVTGVGIATMAGEKNMAAHGTIKYAVGP